MGSSCTKSICCKKPQLTDNKFDVLCNLDKSQIRQLPKNPFAGSVLLVRVTKIIDGDTVRVVGYFNNKLVRQSVRFVGCDAPELKSKNSDERFHARMCKNILQDFLFDKKVFLQISDKKDKYGRILGTIYAKATEIKDYSDEKNEKHIIVTYDVDQYDEFSVKDKAYINVNQWMVDNTPCVQYEGGTKREFTFNPDRSDCMKPGTFYSCFIDHHNNNLID